MATPRVKDTIHDFRELDSILASMAGAFDRTDYSDTLKLATKTIEKRHKEYFDREAGPSGQSWPEWFFRRPDSPVDHPTLQVSGRLKASLVSGGADNVERLSPRELVWGTAVPYSRIHQRGSTHTTGIDLVSRSGAVFLPAGSRITIPKREHVGLDEETTDKAANLIADTAAQTVAAAQWKG